ncbi:hypothetical protein ABPG77_003759 [Micractinium sp. CCAP 211/92]
MDLSGYQALVWSLTGVLLAAFAGFAMVYAWVRRRRLAGSIKFNQEEFITARRQVGAIRIGWSFFAGALGAWVISGPPSYTASGYGYGAGAIGLVFYSLSSGLPVIMVAFAGDLIRRKVPHVLSLTDFMGWRFGYVAKSYVVLLCMFNMAIATLAEYTTIGTLFGVYLGSKAYAITITVGLLTMVYTAYGGLFISIITDQVQGIAVCLLFTICVIYMAADFRHDLPKPFPGDCCSAGADGSFCPENPLGFCLSGKNTIGYSSIFVMPASLFTATVFSEAMWQRAWASADKRALVRGSILGCTGIVLVVFFVGLCGILAAWAGLITDSTDTNLYFLAALGAVGADNHISKWIGVVVMLLAVGMNMSAIDSLQNGLGAAISSHFLKGRPVMWTRAAVLLINVPLIVLGARPGGLDLKVLDLFLIANMICCTSAIPVLSGVLDSCGLLTPIFLFVPSTWHERAKAAGARRLPRRLYQALYDVPLAPYLGGASLVFSCVLSIFLTSVYGVSYYNSHFESIAAANAYLPKYQSKDFSNAMNFTWMGNGYQWQFFLVPLCVSLGALMLCWVFNWTLQRFWGKPAVTGFTAPATHPDLYPAAEPSESDEEAKGSSGSAEFIAKPEDGPVADEFVAMSVRPATAV